jgi:glycosyltransferase involved in cell wall biosynthesis
LEWCNELEKRFWIALTSPITTPLVSVLLPVYNAQDYLRKSIDSILGQTFADFELIIVNDGSTDGSKAIIDSYADPRIVCIDQDNAGLPVSLNRAIAIAKGKYLARQDADDVSEPLRLAEQVTLMDSSALDFCGCDFLRINQQGDVLEVINVPMGANLIAVTLACTVPFAHGSVMMRKQFLTDHHLAYDDSAIEDYDLWCRAYQLGGRFGNVDQCLFRYRHFDQSLSKVKAKMMGQKTRDMRRLFVRENTGSVHNAIVGLLASKEALSLRQKTFFLLATYLVSTQSQVNLVFQVAKVVGLQASMIALAKLAAGF